jgi:hypothetical protein
MGAHKSGTGAQERGCSALRNLMVNAENKVTVAARKGIEAVVRAMEAHGLSAVVQGAFFSFNIARSDSGLQSQVRSAGAVPLRMEALSAFPDHGVLQREEGVLLAKLGP